MLNVRVKVKEHNCFVTTVTVTRLRHTQEVVPSIKSDTLWKLIHFQLDCGLIHAKDMSVRLSNHCHGVYSEDVTQPRLNGAK
jgi:hypothetical protein